MWKYGIGALLGALFGYFVLYKMIGCSSKSCPITSNPLMSVLYGLIMGLLVASIFTGPSGTSTESALTTSSSAVQQEESSGTGTYQTISAEEAKARMDSGDEIIILDVRTAEEYESGHIENALLLPNTEIGEDVSDVLPDKEAEILVYCRSGNRSEQAAKKLVALGYTNVYDFGGIINWPYDVIQ